MGWSTYCLDGVVVSFLQAIVQKIPLEKQKLHYILELQNFRTFVILTTFGNLKMDKKLNCNRYNLLVELFAF
jgi:hypothetical protein